MDIGVIKLKHNTSLKTKRQLEQFFIKQKLFLGWTNTEDGIVVSDLRKAKEIIKVNKNGKEKEVSRIKNQK